MLGRAGFPLLCERWGRRPTSRLLLREERSPPFQNTTTETMMGVSYEYGCELDRTRAKNGPGCPGWRGY
jgi:hypothetical protein